MQATIRDPISCYGIGVHCGKKTQVTLKPAKPNTGIVFIRTDVTALDNVIYATYNKVSDTTLSTSISNDAKIQIATIEHLMAAIWGCGVDNMIVEIDGPEVPIMDGSSKPFVFMIECSGILTQNVPRKYIKLLKEITVSSNESYIHATPSENIYIDLTIDFASPVIGKQQHIFSNHNNNFKEEIADSRTFGFLHELTYLQSTGLAQGASLDNTIGIDKDKILNHDGLRHENEFARHKLLDLFGDLFSSGGTIFSNLRAHKPSHSLNNQFLHTLFSTPSACEFIDIKTR